VFGKGNDFAKKITYKTYNPETKRYEKSETLIQEFRTSPQLRIAVTVDMIATGTDIKPLECLLFLRDVRSRVYFEQMKGRGTRVLTPTDLQAVSGADARAKTHFVIVDAVGVCESDKTDSRPLERQRTVAFDKLLLGVALGKRDEDTLTTLAGRLARLDRELTATEAKSSPGTGRRQNLAKLSATLLNAIDPDAIAERATGKPDADPAEVAPGALRPRAATGRRSLRPLRLPGLREALPRPSRKPSRPSTPSPLTLSSPGFDAAAKEKAAGLVKSFREYIEQHRPRSPRCKFFTAAPTNSASPSRCSRNWKRNCATTTPRGPRTISGTPSPCRARQGQRPLAGRTLCRPRRARPLRAGTTARARALRRLRVRTLQRMAHGQGQGRRQISRRTTRVAEFDSRPHRHGHQH
jgi:hypothetical protein